MVNKKHTMERRQNKRYKAVDGTYAAIHPYSHKLGQIINISMGGLAFQYIDINSYGKKHGETPENTIFLSSMSYYVGNLYFRTILDYEITKAPSFSSMKVKKRHIQFMDLSLKQLFDLDYYLRRNISEQIAQGHY
ncbi:MAG: PilZ domain-containing protein [Desulfobacteraceae bacterium]|nr:PilZ domain-containing protein [Desulfobacteraceae bacterium]